MTLINLLFLSRASYIFTIFSYVARQVGPTGQTRLLPLAPARSPSSSTPTTSIALTSPSAVSQVAPLAILPCRCRRARRGPRPPLRRAAIRASPELWPRVNLLLSATSPPIGAHGELPRVLHFLPGLVSLSFRCRRHRNATGRPAAPAPQLQPPHVRSCTELSCAPALRSCPGCGRKEAIKERS